MPSPPRSARLLSVAAFAPALVLALLVARNAVNVPYWDQWDGEALLVFRAAQGDLRLADLLGQHNEHRLLLPNLVFVALAGPSGWDVRWEMAATFALALLTSLNILALLRRTWPESPGTSALLGFLANLLVFSPIQHENWLWGFQIQSFVPALCFTSCLRLCLGKLAAPRKTVLVALLSAVSTFSFGGGFVCWLALGAVLSSAPKRQRPRLLLLSGGALIACAAAYLHGYRAPPQHPWPGDLAHHPGLALWYVLTLLGYPAAWSLGGALPSVTIAVGVVLLLSFLGACLVLLRHAPESRRPGLLAFGLLGLHAILLCIVVTAGRGGHGLGSAFASRYTTLSLYLPLSALVLLSALLEVWPRTAPEPLRRGVFAVGLAGLVAWSIVATADVAPRMAASRQERSRGKASVLLAALFPNELRPPLHPRPAQASEWAPRLARVGRFQPSPAANRLVSGFARLPETCGALSGLAPVAAGRYRARGTAQLPGGRRADAVLLSVESPSDPDPVIVARDAPWPLLSGVDWEASLDEPATRPVPLLVRAWAFEAERGRICPLAGTFTMAPRLASPSG